jgi:hypothetical protein
MAIRQRPVLIAAAGFLEEFVRSSRTATPGGKTRPEGLSLNDPGRGQWKNLKRFKLSA